MNAVVPLQPPPAMSRDQIELLKQTICKGATDDELLLFKYQCERTGLDPFARQIYAVKRWNSKESREVMQTQTSIDGFRLIADRTGKYAGQVGPWFTADGKTWTDCWLSQEPPRAARIGVLRHDFKEPLYAVAIWTSYVQTGKNGVTQMWRQMPEVMLAKVAEALALRKAFPQELSGLYTGDEMAQADNEPKGQRQQPERPNKAPVTPLPAMSVDTTQRGGTPALPAPEPKRMSATEMQEIYKAMQEADNVESLQTIANDAYRAAGKLKDTEARKQILAWKDERKAQLQKLDDGEMSLGEEQAMREAGL